MGPAPVSFAPPMNDIEYKSGIVSFLDILGFQEILKSQGAKEIHTLLSTFHSEIQSLQKRILGTQVDRSRVHILSDCVFKTVDMTNHFEYKYAAGLVSSEFSYAAAAQGMVFYRHRKLLRGAMTYGDFFADESNPILFGPAVSRAFKVESKCTLQPRIAIDPCLLEAYHSTILPNYPFDQTKGSVCTGSKESILESFYSWITRGDDGVWFIDYLKMFRFWFPYDQDPCDFIQCHKEHIECSINMAITAGRDDLILKYLWLGNYHNKTLNKWEQAGWEESLKGFNSRSLSVSMPAEYKQIPTKS